MTSLHNPAREPTLYYILGVALPPVGAYRYGAAAHSCAAPIAIVWAAALVSLAYALLTGLAGVSVYGGFPLAIGLFLWVFATVWTFLVVRNVHADTSLTDRQMHARRVRQQQDDHDPMDQLDSHEDPR
ncbi:MULTISPECIES: hypothetical protein [unclassified Thioalkalivibrio]|uniref:hypothetical protein n=1 Tax=unclassified Thioalkalivibrio TaxID=2621013 RepID=UPI0003795BC8|nr:MULTISPECIES: hypothetical protein [unclassified Thioalkalivibrio]